MWASVTKVNEYFATTEIKQKLLNCKSLASELIKLRVDCMVFFSLTSSFFTFPTLHYIFAVEWKSIHIAHLYFLRYFRRISVTISGCMDYVSYTLISQICLSFFLPLVDSSNAFIVTRSFIASRVWHPQQPCDSYFVHGLDASNMQIIVYVHLHIIITPSYVSLFHFNNFVVFIFVTKRYNYKSDFFRLQILSFALSLSLSLPLPIFSLFNDQQ